jgi:hypothetical protein
MVILGSGEDPTGLGGGGSSGDPPPPPLIAQSLVDC